MTAELICTAILLLPGIDQADCQRADEALFNTDAKTWNQTTCDSNTLVVERDGFLFTRAAESGNLVWEGCEWEVRAPSRND